MHAEIRPDILVAGGGAAGLATAIALAQAGLSVLLAGMPETIRDDGRSAALFTSNFAFLDRIGVGQGLRDAGWPLRAIRIIDITDALVRSPTTLFNAREIGADCFGWNIANADILRVMREVALATPGLSLSPAFVVAAEARSDEIHVTLSDGRIIATRLLIGADGQKSAVRDTAGIRARIKPYPQVAITCRVSQSVDHDDISTEFHTREGPLTFVPAGAMRSAIVWMMRPERAETLLAAGHGALVEAISRTSSHRFGRLVTEDVIGRVPLQKLVADHLVGPRVALVGEAAHAFPPIGAQGLNLGFRDCESLVSHIVEARRRGDDPGSADTLAGYARSRRLDVEARSAGVDMLNSALIGNHLPLDLARAAGLTLFNALPPLRRFAMRLGGGMPLFPSPRRDESSTRPATCSRQ